MYYLEPGDFLGPYFIMEVGDYSFSISLFYVPIFHFLPTPDAPHFLSILLWYNINVLYLLA